MRTLVLEVVVVRMGLFTFLGVEAGEEDGFDHGVLCIESLHHGDVHSYRILLTS